MTFIKILKCSLTCSMSLTRPENVSGGWITAGSITSFHLQRITQRGSLN